MAENRNVPDTNIDLVIKGEHHVRNFALEQLVNRKSKEGIKDLEAEIVRLKSLLKEKNNDKEITMQLKALLILQRGLYDKNSL